MLERINVLGGKNNCSGWGFCLVFSYLYLSLCKCKCEVKWMISVDVEAGHIEDYDSSISCRIH